MKAIRFNQYGEPAQVLCTGYLVYLFQNQEVNSHAGNLKPPIWCVDWKEKELVEPSLPLFFGTDMLSSQYR